MLKPSESLQPSARPVRRARQRLGWRQELLLAVLPTLTVLVVLAFVEAFSRQRLLFASLASSAFLIYLDPNHGANSTRTLVASQLGAATLGFLAYSFLGTGYAAAAAAMLATIALMIVFDVLHPPAVSTSLSFAFRSGSDSNLLLFSLAVGMVAVLVIIEKVSLRLMARSTAQGKRADASASG